jgi:hypothetical protein
MAISFPFSLGTNAASALLSAIPTTPGASVTFAPGTGSGISANQFEWQARSHYDVINGVVQTMGKNAAGQGNQWIHRYFNLVTNAWVVPNFAGWNGNGTGHVYDDLTIDPALGDLYIYAGIGTNAIQKYTRATNAWSTILTNVFQGGPFIDPINGVTWHPHLFGTNDGGLIITAGTNGNNAGLVYWRKSTGARTQINTTIDAGNQHGCGFYFAAINKAIMGGQSSTSGGSNTANHILVTPNATVGGTPTHQAVGAPPLKTGGDSHAESNFGSIHQHPGDTSRALLLERIGTARRVWQTTDGDNWSLMLSGGNPVAHPFPVNHGITIATLAPHDALWAYSASASVLWRMPN